MNPSNLTIVVLKLIMRSCKENRLNKKFIWEKILNLNHFDLDTHFSPL